MGVFKYYRFIDKWGLLDKVWGPDGGDTCQREGMFWTLLGMMTPEDQIKWLERFERDLDSYQDMMKLLHVDPGVFIRHCRQLNDVNAWDRMSRDQFQTMVSAAGYWDHYALQDIKKGHRSRWWIFTTNTRKNGVTRTSHKYGQKDGYGWKLPDPTGPEIWATFIRADEDKWRRWKLYIYDLETLGASLIWRYKPKHNITLNHTTALLYAMDNWPTFWIRLSAYIMPIEKLVDLAGEHLTDLHPTDDMQFFTEMFRDAKKGIEERRSQRSSWWKSLQKLWDSASRIFTKK